MNSRNPGPKRTRFNNKSTDPKRSELIIIMIIALIAVITISCIGAVALLSKSGKPEETPDPSFTFYEADFEYDIMKDEKYLDLDRTVRFEDPETRITVALDGGRIDEVPTDQHKAVQVILDFINYAIMGKTDELNSLFSDEYIDADGAVKSDFTMQQLYNIKITYVTTSSQTVNGDTQVSYDYWLEYMIRMNNGTFRHDMDSDCVRKEYVRITERERVNEIDVLAPYKTVNRAPSTIDTGTALAIFGISVLMIVAVFALFYIIIKKGRK